MTLKTILLVIVVVTLLALTPCTVTAYSTIDATDVSQYSASASQGNWIYGVTIDSLPVGTNQTHVLNFKGATYLLEINSVNSWVVNNDFWITLTHPNGTSEIVHTSHSSPFHTYKTKIQPVYAHREGYAILQFELDLGVSPMNVRFSDLTDTTTIFDNAINPTDITTAIPFTSVSGQFSGETTSVYIYECTEKQFLDDIKTGNLLPNLNLVGEVFEWTWGAILAFVGMIPVLGPMLITVMGFIGIVGGVIIFWISYVIINSPRIIAGGELLILVFSFLLAGKHPTPERFVKNLVNYNIAAVGGFIWIVGTVYDWTRSFIEMISGIVQALKPI
ncbi:MAG: hypothetical protein WC294_01495 [Methanoregula sp.]|jgi:hypothetical protein